MLPEFPQFPRDVKIKACEQAGTAYKLYGDHEVVPQRVTPVEIDELRSIAWQIINRKTTL